MVVAELITYHDDPEEVEELHSKRISKGKLLIGLAIVAGFLFQSTLAGNISLTSGGNTEFGQGIQQTVACSGNNTVSVVPNVNFTNVSGGGAYYLTSVSVSNIPSECSGSDFTINAYGETSTTPMALFNSTSKNAVVYYKSGTFYLGSGGTGSTVATGSGNFTVTFATPVALAASVSRVTIQSGTHAPICMDGVSCAIGETGPGGGKVFYYLAAGFSCGPTRADTCHYLEAAPPALGLASFDNDSVRTTARTWAQSPNQTTAVPNIGDMTTGIGVGWGYLNTLAIIAQGNSNPSTSAAALAQSYSGGGKSDWYLPSKTEIQYLCNWAINGSCFANAATLNTGSGATGFVGAQYWTSNEMSSSTALAPGFYQGGFQGLSLAKSGSALVRPIRAF
jgi:hypothetical protein